MTKTLYLIRHAKSSWSDPMLSDFERPLNKRGLRDAPFMARLLAGRMQQTVDAILSSPATRAMATADHFAEALGYPLHEIRKVPAMYEAAPWDVIEIIRGLENELHTVLLFGHNPSITFVANKYSEQYIPNVPTCGICQLEADITSWKDWNEHTARLTGFYYPKQYFNA